MHNYEYETVSATYIVGQGAEGHVVRFAWKLPWTHNMTHPILLLDTYFQTLYCFDSLDNLPLDPHHKNSHTTIFFLKQSIPPHVVNLQNSTRGDNNPTQTNPTTLHVHLYVKSLRVRQLWEYAKIRLSELTNAITQDSSSLPGDQVTSLQLHVHYVEGFKSSHNDEPMDENEEAYSSLSELTSDMESHFMHTEQLEKLLHFSFHPYTANFITLGSSLFLLPLSRHILPPFLTLPHYDDFLRSPPLVQQQVKELATQIAQYLHHKKMNCRSSLFALGTFSRWVGEELQRSHLSRAHHPDTSQSDSREGHQHSSLTDIASSFAENSFTQGIINTADKLGATGSTGRSRSTSLSRKRSASNPESPSSVTTFIIVDRLLDMTSCSAHSNHFLDRICGSLKPVNGNPFDVEVVESSILEQFLPQEKNAKKSSKKGSSFLRYFSNVRYGSLASNGDVRVRELFQYMLTHSGQETLSELQQVLLELLGDAGVEGGLASLPEEYRSSGEAQQIKHLYSYLIREHPFFCLTKHSLFQFIAVCVEAITNTFNSTEYRKTFNLQQLIIQQSIEDSSDPDLPSSVLEMILDQIKQKAPLETILSLLIFIYSLYPANTKFLCENEIKILLQKEDAYAMTSTQTEELFAALLKLNLQRTHFKDYRSLIDMTGESSGPSDCTTESDSGYNSLFCQIANHICENRLGPDMVHCNAESVTGFISGSLSRFMFSGRDGPPIIPETCENLVVFCVGGITGADIANFHKRVTPVLREKYPRLKQVEYGSTMIANKKHVVTLFNSHE